MKGRRADDDIRVRFADCDVRLGAEEASTVEFDGVEDGGFVGAEDVDFSVYGAGMVDVEEARGGGKIGGWYRGRGRSKLCHDGKAGGVIRRRVR